MTPYPPPIYENNPYSFSCRERPAWYYLGSDAFYPGWYQEGQKRNVRKPHYHWIWPKDGKRGTKWGRIKDILQGKGPDIHVTISADKMDYMHNRQRKQEWAKWRHLDDRDPDDALRSPSWITNPLLGGRNPGERYDFYSRRYRNEYPGMWSDALWLARKKHAIFPDTLRNNYGEWFQDVSEEMYL